MKPPFNIRIQQQTQAGKKPINGEVTKNADGSGGPIMERIDYQRKTDSIHANRFVQNNKRFLKKAEDKGDTKAAESIQKDINLVTTDSYTGPMINENFEDPKKKASVTKKKDACYRKAKAKYDVFPSAYASGYIAKCRKKKGKIG
jgi:hypothetical protein|tara:strand:- start:4107 stop:4541 length:435 start_codon:yes stop_codon:yes gene_type:complete